MRLLLGSLLLACVPGLALGQTRASTSEIAGRIVDRTAAVLPGATVVALHRATNVEHRATADAEGRFVLSGLPVGAYQVAASLNGFATTTLPEITLAVGERADLAITLELAAVATQVDVTAAGAVVDLQKTSISAVLSERQIMSLPSNGRDFISFATLTPGVATDRGLGALQSSGLSFAGQRGRSNNISLDGF